MSDPDLGAWFGGIDSAILSKGRQLCPNFTGGAIVRDLKYGMFEGGLGKLNPKRTIQALDTAVGREDDRQQLFQPAVLPGTVKSRGAANHQHAAAQFPAITGQHFLLRWSQVGRTKI